MADGSVGVNAGFLLDRITALVRSNLPRDITPGELDLFVEDQRAPLLELIETQLIPAMQRRRLGGDAWSWPADLLNVRERAEANIAAMELLARSAGPFTAAQKRAIAQYSGWGGIGTLKRYQDRFPKGFPVPEADLLHAYYTPTKVWQATAVALEPFRASLLDGRTSVRALEPSAGVGRAMGAFLGWPMGWTAAEYSDTTARFLRALFPASELHVGPFEGWIARNQMRTFDLVVANPPYGARGETAELDPDTSYRTPQASLYFVRRTLDLLRPGGIGVYLIPPGFLTSSKRDLAKAREDVLRRHHLMAAFRLPSVPPEGGSVADVIYDNLVVDLLFFRARGVELPQVPASDVAVAEGRYFELYPKHLLGEAIGAKADAEKWDETKPKIRFGYQVRGRFDGLPAWTERPMADAGGGAAIERRELKVRGGIARDVRDVSDLTPELASAVALGMRIDRHLALVAKQDPAAEAGHGELVRDLETWRAAHGDPAAHRGLAAVAKDGVVGAQRFLTAWSAGVLVKGLRTPPKIEARYTGERSLIVVADWLYRQAGGQLTMDGLRRWWKTDTGQELSVARIRDELLPTGWALNGDDGTELVPDRVYYSGFLWPKVERAAARADDPVFARQAEKLRQVIGWREGTSLVNESSPVDAWLPASVVTAFCREKADGRGAKLVRDEDGILTVEGHAYSALHNDEKHRNGPRDLFNFIGWANRDARLWNPEREQALDESGQPAFTIDSRGNSRAKLEPMELARDKHATVLTEEWRRWILEHPDHLRTVEEQYNRKVRGYKPPEYPADPLPLARWGDAVKLQEHQNRGARKILDNRCGILAFDVGLGKTYTGIGVIGMARQEGWAKRPVVLVPNSIIWKWYRDFARCLPDFRVLVIGSKRSMALRGARKGKMVATPDTPEERAQKWTQFQAGEADVVLLTYSALGRTQMDAEFVEAYVNKTVAIRRSVMLSVAREEALASKKAEEAPRTERREADSKSRVRSWLGRVLAPPKGWSYDPGIDWHALGVDLLLVDEAQNYKNLFSSEREGGAEKTDTKRSWMLDFRCASVRHHSGGAGVILLSATPAKNSPVEFYNIAHFVNPKAFERAGVLNHEDFLTRYGAFTRKSIPNGLGKLVDRSVCAAFQNVDELRDVLGRYAEFRVAEEVGLKLPTVLRRTHYAPPSKAMISAFMALGSEVKQLEERAKNAARLPEPAKTQAMYAIQMARMGLRLRFYMTALHPALPELGGSANWNKAKAADSPKIIACRDEILKTADKVCSTKKDAEWCLDCGHIVFADNIAVHYWMREALVAAGIPRERIAILNAEEAGDTEFRQQIVEGFNGVGNPDDDEFSPPAYDIVIANAVAYEGMDLQRRTCAIHHLDVPWEPATLQQRNGRGVRQGNQFQDVTIHFYFVKGSNEDQRVERIERKRGWMASLVTGQARGTNTTTENDGDGEDRTGFDDLPLELFDEHDRRAIMDARKAQAAAEAAASRRARAVAANRQLRDAQATFRRAEVEADPERAGRLRAEAEALLADLAKVPSDVWPHFDRAVRVRDTSLYIPILGMPLAPGERVRLDGDLVEVGAVREAATWELAEGQPWRRRGQKEDAKATKPRRGAWMRSHGWLSHFVHLPEDAYLLNADGNTRVELDVAWPEERPEVERMVSWGATDWPSRGWHRLAPSTQDHLWPALEEAIRKKDRSSPWAISAHDDKNKRERVIPMLDGGRLVLFGSRDAGLRDSIRGLEFIPPTASGWARFSPLAEAKPEEERAAMNRAAYFWFARRLPRRDA